MDITVTGTTLLIGTEHYPCMLGRAGLRTDKREGDGATPVGTFPLREVFYRPDRVEMPRTGLPASALTPGDGWCDDPTHPAYNTRVTLPFAGSHEALWREDHAYDLIVVIGYNDAPAIPGKGSAIFMHLTHDDGRPTAGCVAVSRADMLAILAQLTTHSRITLSAS